MPSGHVFHEPAVNRDKNLLFLRFLLNDNQDLPPVSPQTMTVMFSSLPSGHVATEPWEDRDSVPPGGVARTGHGASPRALTAPSPAGERLAHLIFTMEKARTKTEPNHQEDPRPTDWEVSCDVCP